MRNTFFPVAALAKFFAVLSVLTSIARPQHVTKLPPRIAAAQQHSPRDWVVLASNNEVTSLTHDNSFFRYRTHIIDQKGDRVRDVVETKDGTVARTIMEGGKPLGASAEAAERTRLEGLSASTSEFKRHVKNDLAGKKLAADLIRLMPDAMVYTFAPGESGARSSLGAPLIVLDYEPNPSWKPPTTTSEALTGLKGRVWIDAASGYVTRLDGEIFRPVNIGWGMLAHVYPGGRLSLEQVNLGEDRWLYSHFIEQAHVRALMVKTLDVSAEISTSNYQRLPTPPSYQEAIRLLLR